MKFPEYDEEYYSIYGAHLDKKLENVYSFKVISDLIEEKNLNLFIATLGEEAKTFAVKLIRDLRQKNIICEMDYLQRSLKAQMKEANRQKAEKVLIIGEEEIKKGKAVLRDMKSGEQEEIELANVGRIWS